MTDLVLNVFTILSLCVSQFCTFYYLSKAILNEIKKNNK